MKRLVIGLALATAVVSGTPVAAQTGATEDSLKATHALLMKAVASANVSLIAGVVHPRAVGFFRESQVLVELRPGVTVMDVVPGILTDLSLFTAATNTATVFRVAGDVGLIALTSAADSKSGQQRDRWQRSTFVYLHTADGWKLVTWHTSDTPLKR